MSNQPPAHVADERAAHKKTPGEMTLREAAEIVVAGYYDGNFSDVLMRYEALATPAAVLELLRAAIPAGADVASIDTPEFRRLLTGVESARWGDCEPARQRLIAHINAWCRRAAGAPAETPKECLHCLGLGSYAHKGTETICRVCGGTGAAQPAPSPATDARDGERLDFLETAHVCSWFQLGQKIITDTRSGKVHSGATWREAIDSAMLSANSPREAG